MPTLHDLACDMVVKYEMKNGRKAVNVADKHLGYDIEGVRNIEVKCTTHSKMPNMCSFYEPSWNWFRKDPKAWLYIVYDMKRKPRLMMLSRDDVLNFETGIWQEIWVKIPKTLRKAIEDVGAEIEL